MPRTKTPNKPPSREPKIKINQTYVNPSDMRGLPWAWKDKRLVLFLGAGVSIPYGIPTFRSFPYYSSTRICAEGWPNRPRSCSFHRNDYHGLTHKTFHWGLSEIVNELRHSTVLFIGLSMSDPSLRRLLDASQNSKIPPHWQLQKRHQVRAHEQQAAMTDITNRANRWGQILGYPEQKDQPQLAEALNAALQQADTYDRELFESMGVKTIWLDSYDDIPYLLDRIPAKPRKTIKP